MLLRSLFLRFILSLSMIMAGGPASARFITLPGIGALSVTKLKDAGIAGIQTARAESGEIIYQFLDEGGQVIRSLSFAKATPEALREFQPSKLERYFTYLRQNSKGIAVQKLKQFPFEAFTFFVAIGAITVSDLIFKFNENPVAMDQFLESQKSVVGQVGFAAFMVANGLTAEPLMAVAQSRGARMFIPYLGMSVGMTASNIVHEIAHLPLIKECAAEIATYAPKAAVSLARSGEVPGLHVCDRAFAEWAKINWAEKGHEWAPSLVSMLAATAAAGITQWGIVGASVGAISMSSGAIARVVAIEMLLSLTSGGWALRGVRWTAKVAQLAGFVYLDTVFRAPVTFAWKNSIQLGPSLRTTSERMGVLMTRKLANGWRPETGRNAQGRPVCAENQNNDCYMDLDREMLEFQDLMMKWRQTNLESVLMAHGNWSQYLYQLSSQYRVARQFYFDYVSDLWKKKYELAPDYKHLMDRPLPLFGVVPKGLTAEEVDKFLSQPNRIQAMQMETIADIVKALNDEKEGIDEAARSLSESERKIFQEILNRLASNDPQQVGLALEEIRYRIRADHARKPVFHSNRLVAMLKPIFQAAGNPRPYWAPGQGYLKLLVMDPNTQAYDNNPYPSSTGGFMTPLATEHLVYQMFMGPDVAKGDKLISTNLWGFPSSFTPPMIRPAGNLRSHRFPTPDHMSLEQAMSIFSLNVRLQTDRNETLEGTMFDILRNGGVRPEILGDEKGHKIGEWWERYPETELVQAWLNYEGKYEDIIQDFHQKLFRTGSSWTNRGPIGNGILQGMDEERGIYLYILDSFLNSLEQKRSAAPTAASRYSILEPAAALQSSANEWTRKVMAEWNNIRELLKKLESKPVRTRNGNKEFIVSRVTNKELGDLAEKMGALLREYPGQKNTLTPFQKRVVESALRGLQVTQAELVNFAMIINNVSYVENFEGRALTEPAKKRCLGAQARRGSMQWLQHQYEDCQN